MTARRSRSPGPPPIPRPSATPTAATRSTTTSLAFIVDPARCVPDTVNHYFQPVHWSKVAGVPITYVLNERDRPVLPAAQEEMSARLPPPATVVRVDSGHMLPVTAPATLADLLAALPA